MLGFVGKTGRVQVEHSRAIAASPAPRALQASREAYVKGKRECTHRASCETKRTGWPRHGALGARAAACLCAVRDRAGGLGGRNDDGDGDGDALGVGVGVGDVELRLRSSAGTGCLGAICIKLADDEGKMGTDGFASVSRGAYMKGERERTDRANSESESTG